MSSMTDIPVKPFLEIKKLNLQFKTRNGLVQVLNDVDLNVNKGEILGVVGESGSGKSVTAYSILNLNGASSEITSGTILFEGMELHNPSTTLLKDIRGREISMIFQNPMSTLNPIRTVKEHLQDMLLTHVQATKASSYDQSLALLEQVKIRNPKRVLESYPFELSGGMCQRVVIALALACSPRLLIADEPTTGLDVTTQKVIMDLIRDLAKDKNMAVMLITHDLGMAAKYCQNITVMEKGKVIENADVATLFKKPKQNYTKKLIAATPRQYSQLSDLTPHLNTSKPFNKDNIETGIPSDKNEDYILEVKGFSR